MKTTPLVIDLDGTLIRTDLLAESIAGFLRHFPLQGYKLFFWLLRGKGHLKMQLAKRVTIDVEKLPYDPDVLALIQSERDKGRKIVLATASALPYAEEISAHLGLFDQVLATDETVNLSAHRKRDRLVAEYGEKQFDYAGNASDDVVVWQSARYAYVVSPECGVLRTAEDIGNVEAVFQNKQSSWKGWLKAFRLHQWVKNLLIFVPLIASHHLTDGAALGHGLLAFLFFGLCASSVYVLNDILDLEDDRHHCTKCYRPFASGKISIKYGLIVWPLLLVASFSGALILLPVKFTVALAAYYVLTVAYSLVLKRRMGVDVITLAILYTLRIVAGSFAMNISLTFWMLAFSMFIFLSLALVKRYAELHDAKLQGRIEKTRGRGYYPDDLPVLSSLGAASGYLSVMVLALYIQDKSTQALYHHPQLIWLACPLLLYWVTRVWLITHRGMMHEDPVVFAVKDRISLCVGVMFGLIFWLAA